MHLDRTFAQLIGSVKVKSKSEVNQCSSSSSSRSLQRNLHTSNAQ